MENGNLTQTLIMMLGMAGLFYFFVVRPEQRRRRTTESFRNDLKKGDRVLAFGFFGTVLKIKEKSVILALHEDTKVEVLKEAISGKAPDLTD